MNIYEIKYMHGDADAFTTKTFEVKEDYKNKLIKLILKIFEEDIPEWRDPFLNKISESLIEEYLIDNYEEEEDTPELWDEIEILLRKERAKKFIEILKEAYETDTSLTEYELDEIQKLISKDLDSLTDKDIFYNDLFDFCMELVDMYKMLIPDATCIDRYASIKKIEIKNSYFDEITKKLNSLSNKELEKLKELIDKKLK